MDEDTTVDEPADAKEVNTPEEPTQAENDALLSASEGVDGTLTPNSEETTEEPSKDEPEEPTQPEPEEVPEIKTETDEAGVYSPPTSTDPGDFQPQDYSFEVKTTDGKTHKISSPEEIDAFASALDNDPELITASQFSTFNRKSALMEQGIASDRKEYEANKVKFEEESALQQTRDSAVTQWNNEINYLADNGDLPEISDEMNQADWTDPNIAKDPAVKARLDIFKWMESENNKRLSAGLEPIKSVIDAHNAMQLDSIRKSNKETVSREKETRQKKGSMVGGASSFNPTNVPANTIIGTGGNLNDLVTDFMNQ